jgi:hypothetical protein
MTSKTAFFMCPIGEPESTANQRSRKLLKTIVMPTLKRFGFYTNHFLDADYRRDKEGIRTKMRDWIQTADVCIADLTEDNPNVLFEYGFRRAAGLPVLAVVQKGQKLLFDVDDYPTCLYDLETPEPAIGAIEAFVSSKGFALPSVQVAAERRSQTGFILDYIARTRPRKIDILHVSLLSMADEIFLAVGNADATIRVLLMHPDEAARYALGKSHTLDILKTEERVRRNPDIAMTYKYACPTVGLWYYRHEPSVAAAIIDDALVQLGWYFREPAPNNPDKVRLAGHTQPSVLAEGDSAHELLPKIRAHFHAVWLYAEPGPPECFNGPRGSELLSEWQSLRQRAGIVKSSA